MKRLLLAATVAAMAVTTAQAQTTTPAPQAPAAQPAPDAQHPPTNRMDKTVPDMKTQGAEHAPTNRMGEAVPPMKPGDPPKQGPGGTQPHQRNRAISVKFIEVSVETIRTGNPKAVKAFNQRPSVGDKPTKRSIVMDWDRIEGNWKQFSGKVKEKWGQLTDDDLSKINGRRDQLEGIIQQRYGYAKDQARDEVDRWSKTL